MPPTRAALVCRTVCPSDLTCPLVSSRDRPGCSRKQTIDEPAPSLRPHYRASPLLRAGPPAGSATVLSASGFCRAARSLSPPAPETGASAGVGTRLPTFHAGAAGQAHAAYTPDTAWPVGGLPPGSSRELECSPVLMSLRVNDASSAVRSRSSSWSLPDA